MLNRLGLADAHRVFDGIIVKQPDTRFDYDEQRMIAVGMPDAIVVLIVHVERDDAFALFQ